MSEIKRTRATFKVILHNFKITRNKYHKFLQFTRTWRLNHPLMGELGDDIDHCIAFYRKDGSLKWNPPVSLIPGLGMKKQLHAQTTPLYTMVLEALKKCKYLEQIKPELEYEMPDTENSVEVSMDIDLGKETSV